MTAAAADRAKLRDDLARFWSLVESHLAAAQAADLALGRPARAMVAVDLHHAYQAFECLLQKLESALELPARRGDAWHSEILDAAALPVEGRRPPVFPSEALAPWHAVRKFRHWFRHGSVAVEFNPDDLEVALGDLARAVGATGPSVGALLAALD